MAGSTYTIKYVKYIKYWLKKGAGTAAILEGVGISAPLMRRYVGWACGYRMVPQRRADMSNGWVYIYSYVCKVYKIMVMQQAPERPPYWKALELARRIWNAM